MKTSRMHVGVMCVQLVLLFGWSVAPASADSGAYQRALHATGWIIVPEENGYVVWGTCWVVDRARREVITDCHVVSGSRRARVYFPRYIDGEVIHDSSYYLGRLRPIDGQVIYKDVKRDLALVRLDSLPLGVQALRLASEAPKVGEAIHSIGTSPLLTPGEVWRHARGKVRRVFFMVTANRSKWEACAVETRSLHAQGDSGSAIVNSKGEVIGVLHGTSRSRKKRTGYATEVSEVKEFLTRAHPRDKIEPASKLVSASPIVGTWKGSSRSSGTLSYCSATFRPDGTFEWYDSTKHRKGRYRFKNGVLRIDGEVAELRGSRRVSWVSKTRFKIFVNASEYSFRRR
jgi:S1-C subfamily serine protease